MPGERNRQTRSTCKETYIVIPILVSAATENEFLDVADDTFTAGRALPKAVTPAPGVAYPAADRISAAAEEAFRADVRRQAKEEEQEALYLAEEEALNLEEALEDAVAEADLMEEEQENDVHQAQEEAEGQAFSHEIRTPTGPSSREIFSSE